MLQRKCSILKRAKRITRSSSIGCSVNQYKDKNEVWKKVNILGQITFFLFGISSHNITFMDSIQRDLRRYGDVKGVRRKGKYV